jgi:1-phosphofructokinase family hexose kinase
MVCLGITWLCLVLRGNVPARMSPPKVLAVCPNPALDRTATVVDPAAGGMRRAAAVIESPGGKATHAASVARALGCAVTVVCTLAGGRGRRVAELLAARDIEVAAIEVEGETRGTYTVVDERRGAFLEVIEPGPRLDARDVARLLDLVTHHSRGAAVVVAAGSLPPGAPDDLYADVVGIAHHAGAKAVVDASGEPLSAALGAAPDLVKPNAGEARDLLGNGFRPDGPIEDVVAAARAVRARGARAAWLSLGARGSLLADEDDGCWMLDAPAGAVVNAVGCGDAMVGGAAAALASGVALAEAIGLGAAAAASKLAALAPDEVVPDDVRRLAAHIELTQVGA